MLKIKLIPLKEESNEGFNICKVKYKNISPLVKKIK